MVKKEVSLVAQAHPQESAPTSATSLAVTLADGGDVVNTALELDYSASYDRAERTPGVAAVSGWADAVGASHRYPYCSSRNKLILPRIEPYHRSY